MDVKVVIKNLAQFKKAFNQSPAIVGAHLDRAIKKTVISIGRASRILTPVDTGRLRASTKETFRPLYGEVGTFVNYDIFVHSGTRYMKARPYLLNAVKENENAIQSYFKVELQNALDKIARMT